MSAINKLPHLRVDVQRKGLILHMCATPKGGDVPFDCSDAFRAEWELLLWHVSLEGVIGRQCQTRLGSILLLLASSAGDDCLSL